MIRNNQPGHPRFTRAAAFTILGSKMVLALHDFGGARVCRIQSAQVRPHQILLCHYSEGLAAFTNPERFSACSQQQLGRPGNRGIRSNYHSFRCHGDPAFPRQHTAYSNHRCDSRIICAHKEWPYRGENRRGGPGLLRAASLFYTRRVISTHGPTESAPQTPHVGNWRNICSPAAREAHRFAYTEHTWVTPRLRLSIEG